MAHGDTRARLIDVAGDHDLHIATWSPGDGATRYRFIDAHQAPGDIPRTLGGQLDYYGAPSSRVCYTALGLAEAWSWMRGYIAAANAQTRRDYIDREHARREVTAY
jgi:hypothetical protein